MRFPCLRSLTLVALMATPALLSAQSKQKVSAQFSVLSTGIVASGGLINGVGVEPQLRINARYFAGLGVLSVGAGGQYTSHTSANDISIRIAGAFVEPRLLLARLATSRVGPYVAARVAALRQSNDIASSSSGIAVGAGGGVGITLSERINLDLGVSGLLQNWSESVTTSGRPFIRGSMSSYAAKIGLNYGF